MWQPLTLTDDDVDDAWRGDDVAKHDDGDIASVPKSMALPMPLHGGVHEFDDGDGDDLGRHHCYHLRLLWLNDDVMVFEIGEVVAVAAEVRLQLLLPTFRSQGHR